MHGFDFLSLVRLYTFETLLALSLTYLLTIPVSIIIYRRQQKYLSKISEDDHEDIL